MVQVKNYLSSDGLDRITVKSSVFIINQQLVQFCYRDLPEFEGIHRPATQVMRKQDNLEDQV